MSASEGRIGPVQIGVGVKIRARRTVRRWTLAELAECLSEVGWPVSVATLSRIEHGKGNVSADLLVALSAVFGTPIADLLGSVSAGQIISDDPLTPSEVQAVRRLLAGES